LAAEPGPIVGGRLISALPGPVTITALTPPDSAFLAWSTGSGAGDWTDATTRLSDLPPIYSTSWLQQGTHVFSGRLYPGPTGYQMVHTGTDKHLLIDVVPSGQVVSAHAFAAVFPGPGNTVNVGFLTSPTSPLFSNFLDYPIRVLISNVCAVAK
jgi:hypothetical protein